MFAKNDTVATSSYFVRVVKIEEKKNIKYSLSNDLESSRFQSLLLPIHSTVQSCIKLQYSIMIMPSQKGIFFQQQSMKKIY